MDAIRGRRLEIKSYNEEVLKEIQAYFAKYPKLPDVLPEEEMSQIEKDLRDELEYLKLVLNKK